MIQATIVLFVSESRLAAKSIEEGYLTSTSDDHMHLSFWFDHSSWTI